jgi:hypothetical protein
MPPRRKRAARRSRSAANTEEREAQADAIIERLQRIERETARLRQLVIRLKAAKRRSQ